VVKLWEEIVAEGNERLDAKAVDLYQDVAEGEEGWVENPSRLTGLRISFECPESKKTDL